MHLRQLLMAGGTVEIVDVLSDQMAQDADLLQLDHGRVSGVRLRLSQGPDDFVRRPQTFFPIALRVRQETLVDIHRRLAMLRPQAAWSTKRGECHFPPIPQRRSWQ